MSKNNPAQISRLFLRRNHNGILSTISLDVPGFPFGSVCPYIVDPEGRPVILISTIAQHTKNINANPKVCLTVSDESHSNRQETARISYIGLAQPIQTNRSEIEQRYLRCFPEAKDYFNNHDFEYYVIDCVRIRFIEGFAKIFWVEKENFLLSPSNLLKDEKKIIDHMNQDHRDALLNYCQHYHGLTREHAQIILVDSEGFLIRTEVENIYFPFQNLCLDVNSVRNEMVRMAKESKDALSKEIRN